MDYYAHPSSIIDQDCYIGKGTKIWHFSHIMSGCHIEDRCNIGQNCVISPGVTIGKNVKIQNNVSVYTGIICEDDVFIGPSVVFTNILNPRSAVIRKDQYLKTIIKKGASLGANSTILCGIEIGSYALIGAGSVVTKDVNPYSLMVGNPAKHTGWVSEYGHKLIFDSNQQALCPEEKSSYNLKDGVVIKL